MVSIDAPPIVGTSYAFFGDPTDWATTVEAVSMVTGVTASVVTAGFTGVAGLVYSSPVGEESDVVLKEACPPKPGNQDPCKGLRDILKDHERKLAQYLSDPISMDNKNHLGYAISKGNMDLFWKIRANRIKELYHQIENFRKQLEECEKRYGKNN